MYRRGTSVAVPDFERELANLLPIDDYFDENEHPRQKNRKRSNKTGASGQKVKNRIDLSNIESSSKLDGMQEGGPNQHSPPMNTLEEEIMEMMRQQDVPPG